MTRLLLTMLLWAMLASWGCSPGDVVSDNDTSGYEDVLPDGWFFALGHFFVCRPIPGSCHVECSDDDGETWHPNGGFCPAP